MRMQNSKRFLTARSVLAADEGFIWLNCPVNKFTVDSATHTSTSDQFYLLSHRILTHVCTHIHNM